MEKPGRRWFRFSLRTMFVLLTVLAIALAWLGVQIKWISDRQRVTDGNRRIECYEVVNNTAPAPWSLRVLGEGGVSLISVWMTHNPAADDERVRELERLFPEARVRLQSLPYPATRD